MTGLGLVILGVEPWNQSIAETTLQYYNHTICDPLKENFL